jgi:class 3 adenylate cyclase
VRHFRNNRAIIKYKDLQYDNTKIFKETGVSLIFLGSYMGTEVAIKQIKSKKQMQEHAAKEGQTNGVSDRRTINLAKQKGSKGGSRGNTVNLKSSNSLSSNKVTPSTSAGQSTIAMEQEGGDQDGLKAIKTEIRLLNQIRHPNCVLFLGAAYHEKNIYMVTEYMSHGALGEILVNPSIQIELKTKLKIATDISNGVNYLHMLTPALLHADIKSGNVFVNADLRGKIGDFGSTTMESKQTRCGTPFWMAPELLNGGCNMKQTDVYALGVTFWELFAREELYPDLADATLSDVATFVGEGGRPALTNAGLIEEVKPFIERVWHQNPEARPTCQECYDFFREISENTDVAAKYAEKKNNDNNDLLYKILPPEIAAQLRNGEKVKPMDCPEVTILFSDIVGFTNISSSLEPKDVMDMLNRLYQRFDALTLKHGLFKVETIGDAYMVAGGIFNGQDEQAEKIALQGMGMIRAANEVLIHEDKPELGTVKIRVGCHTGPIVASVVGDLNPRFCLFGDTVNFASRMESTSLKQRFQCTKSTQKKLMAEAPQFVAEVRGTIEVKGKGTVSTYFIEASNPQAKTLTEEFPHES